jgi:hypothetical protein
MQKIIISTLLSFFIFTARAQDQYDVRKTRWEMSVNEVIASEYPLTPSETKTDGITYASVKLSNGNTAKIYYSFTNAKLTKIYYDMYGNQSSISRGTCTKIISLFHKINFTHFVFDDLKEKRMKCDMGWYLVNCSSAYPVGYKNCNLDQKTIEKMEKAAKETNCERIALNFENERTDALFYFNQYENVHSGIESPYSKPCDDEFYNMYYTLIFAPSYKLENEMKKRDF